MEHNNQLKPSDLKQIFKTILRHKWLVIIPWIIVSGIAAIGSYMMPPEYQSMVIISIDSGMSLSPAMSQQVGYGNQGYRQGNQSDRLRSYHNELLSSHFLSQLNVQLKLDQNPVIQEEINSRLLSQPDLSRNQMAIHILQAQYKDKIDIRFVGENQLRIAVSTGSPTDAKNIAEVLGNIFINEKQIQQVRMRNTQQNFSSLKLEAAQQTLNDKIQERTDFESKLLEDQLREDITSGINHDAISNEIYSVKEEITQYQQLELAQTEELSRSDDPLISSPDLVESERLRNINSAIRKELATTDRLMSEHSWNSDPIRSFRVRLGGLVSDIENVNRRLVENQFSSASRETKQLLVAYFNGQANLKYLRSKTTTMEKAFDDLNARISRIPVDQAKLDQISEEVLAATGVRDMWISELSKATTGQEIASAYRYRVVEPAKIPLAPFKPNRIQITLMGVVLGLVIGISAVVVAELMDNSFKKVDEITDELGLPVLGVVPKMTYLKKVGP